MLSERLSQRLAQWLLKKQSIQEKEYEVYCYCLDYMIQLLLFCVVIEMLGMIGKELVFSSLFLLMLIPMRSVCGGIHAKTRGICTVLSYSCFIAAYIIFRLIKGKVDGIWYLVIVTLVICLIVMFPVTVHQNKSICEKQLRKLQKRKYGMCGLLYIVTLGSYFWNKISCLESVAICISIVFCSLLLTKVEKIKSKRSDNESDRCQKTTK